MKKRITYFVLLMFVVITGCEEENNEPKKITSEDLNFEVTFKESFENTIYPSFILGLSKLASSENESFEFIKYSLEAPEKDHELKVVLNESSINNETILQEYMDFGGGQISYYPMINWNYEKLKTLKQQGNVDLSFTAYIDGEEIDNKTLRLNYRSVNECITGYIDEENNYEDLTWMFAGYVNEDHPKIDEFLSEVLGNNVVDNFDGYQQGTEESVIDQAFAIWHTLQKKGVTYSSITNTSNPSDKIFTQHVRFFEEVYNNNQANCVDGSVFLSSIFKKIDIKPFLVLVPSHMYMGFYTSSDKTSFELLETTMIGHINLNEINEDNLLDYGDYITQETYDAYLNGYCTLEYVKTEISWISFVDAIYSNREQWNNNLPKFNDSNNYDYQTLDIETLRGIVQPIAKKKTRIVK